MEPESEVRAAAEERIGPDGTGQDRTAPDGEDRRATTSEMLNELCVIRAAISAAGRPTARRCDRVEPNLARDAAAPAVR